MTRMYVFLICVFGAIVATGAVANASPCNVRVKDFVALTDGKTYGIALSSYGREVRSVRLTMWSATASYTVDLASVSFATVRTSSDPMRGFIGPTGLPDSIDAEPRFFTLPEADMVLAVRAAPIVETSSADANAVCFPPLAVRNKDGRYAGLDRDMRRLGEDAPAPVMATALARRPSPLACATPFAEAVTYEAVEPDYPWAARQNGDTGTVLVDVKLSREGAVEDTAIRYSSGSTWLDRAALDAAAKSKYHTEVFLCDKVRGEYVYRADFAGR